MGVVSLRSVAAAMMPSAMTSQRMIPPKMLTRMAFTLEENYDLVFPVITANLLSFYEKRTLPLAYEKTHGHDVSHSLKYTVLWKSTALLVLKF